MAKISVASLDAGQLEMMWSFLQLGQIEATDADVDNLIQNADIIRQALIQKTAGQRSGDPKGYVDFNDLGTYINMLVLNVLVLRIGGRLERMKEDTG